MASDRAHDSLPVWRCPRSCRSSNGGARHDGTGQQVGHGVSHRGAEGGRCERGGPLRRAVSDRLPRRRVEQRRHRRDQCRWVDPVVRPPQGGRRASRHVRSAPTGRPCRAASTSGSPKPSSMRGLQEQPGSSRRPASRARREIALARRPRARSGRPTASARRDLDLRPSGRTHHPQARCPLPVRLAQARHSLDARPPGFSPARSLPTMSTAGRCGKATRNAAPPGCGQAITRTSAPGAIRRIAAAACSDSVSTRSAGAHAARDQQPEVGPVPAVEQIGPVERHDVVHHEQMPPGPSAEADVASARPAGRRQAPPGTPARGPSGHRLRALSTAAASAAAPRRNLVHVHVQVAQGVDQGTGRGG